MMTDCRARRLWFSISVVFISYWFCPTESANYKEDGASDGTQPSIHRPSQQPTSEQKYGDSSTTGFQRPPELPSRQRRLPALQRNLYVPPNSSTPKQREAVIPQCSPALNPDTSGLTDTRGNDQSQRSLYLHYDIPRSHLTLPETGTQRHQEPDYDFPRSYASSQGSPLGTQRHRPDHYDIPRSHQSQYDIPCSPPRLDGNDQASPASHKHPTASLRQKKLTSPTAFDWLKAPAPPNTGKIPKASVRQSSAELGAYNTIAGTRPRTSTKAGQGGASQPVTFTLPRSLGKGKRDISFSHKADFADVAASERRKQPDAGHMVEIIDPPEDTSAETYANLERKFSESRGLFSQFLTKMRLPLFRRRAATKSQKGDDSASCNQANANEASARGASAVSTGTLYAQRNLPPLPVEAPENRYESVKEACSVHSAQELEVWDEMIRKELSPDILEAVLLCEQRILKALQSGTLTEFLSKSDAVEEFQFFSAVIAHFSKGLNLTPAEQLFIMWALECSTPSARCPPALLLEMIPVFEFIAGFRPLHVPPDVKVLLSLRNNGEVIDTQKVPSPVLSTGGTVLRTTIPEKPFALFFHRISSDPVRRQTVQEMVESWQLFTGEIKFLLFFNGMGKSLDYSLYRTRFIVYAYTVDAVKLCSKRTASSNPVDFAVHGCSEDLLFVRRMADPNVRNAFVENLRRNYLDHIRRHARIPD